MAVDAQQFALHLAANLLGGDRVIEVLREYMAKSPSLTHFETRTLRWNLPLVSSQPAAATTKLSKSSQPQQEQQIAQVHVVFEFGYQEDEEIPHLNTSLRMRIGQFVSSESTSMNNDSGSTKQGGLYVLSDPIQGSELDEHFTNLSLHVPSIKTSTLAKSMADAFQQLKPGVGNPNFVTLRYADLDKSAEMVLKTETSGHLSGIDPLVWIAMLGIMSSSSSKAPAQMSTTNAAVTSDNLECIFRDFRDHQTSHQALALARAETTEKHATFPRNNLSNVDILSRSGENSGADVTSAAASTKPAPQKVKKIKHKHGYSKMMTKKPKTTKLTYTG